jgi:FKBP-type peptidyl-prolyl cis-trans isomerase 2
VIPGWEQAVRLMKVGQSAYVMLPPDLAYGSEGFGDMVPPNATLVFKIEILKVIEEEEEEVCLDPFEETEPNCPNFDKHTPGF